MVLHLLLSNPPVPVLTPVNYSKYPLTSRLPAQPLPSTLLVTYYLAPEPFLLLDYRDVPLLPPLQPGSSVKALPHLLDRCSQILTIPLTVLV